MSGDAPVVPNQLFQKPVDRTELEIGFGGGEHLLAKAQSNPDTGFIGCEPFIDGMAKMVSAVVDNHLTNVRLFDDDAVQLLDRMKPRSIDKVYLLYPDPWPKKRHRKRRFVNPNNIAKIHRILKPGGRWMIATDIADYVNWALFHITHNGGFQWLATNAGDWKVPPQDWQPTRYEKKAIREGRYPTYLMFEKNPKA